MISKLLPGMTNVSIVGVVVSKGDKRSVNTKYGKSTVCDVVIKDETGEIGLTLWNEQIGTVKEGEEVKIEGGYITEWQGEIKLNVPKRGVLEKIAQPL